MDRLFWIGCPRCGKRFICDYELRQARVDLECPFCQSAFRVDEGQDIDDRWFA